MSFIILKSEYLKLIQRHSKLIAELPKAVQFCAAKLIRYFQRWSEWKQNVHRTMWIYMPFKKIHEDLMGEHSLHVIRAAIALLEKLGLIEKRHNPNGQDKTWQYKLNKDTLSSLLNIEARHYEPSSAITDSEDGTFKTEHGEINVEQHTQDQSIDIKATTTKTSIKETSEAGNQVSLLEESDGSNYPDNVSKSTQNPEKLLTPEVNKTEAITNSSSTPRTTNTTPPTPSQLSEVKRQLRELRVNPDSCKGVIVNHWANVPNAIAYLKTATWAKSPIAVFINACKKGLTVEEDKSERSAIPTETRPPTEEQFKALDTARSRKEIKDYFFSGDGITKVVLFNGFQLPWWDFLEDSVSAK